MLAQTIGSTAEQQSTAEYLIEENLLGHHVTDIEVMTAIKQAEISLKTLLQVRNKVVEAYNELKQVQV